MAGRKASPKPDLLSMLLEKMGVPQKKKATKGKRKKRPRPVADEAAYTDGYAPPAATYGLGAEGAASPFGDYGQESGLGFDSNYEAAAAAGYAPAPVGGTEEAFAALVTASEPAAELPRFFDEPAAAPAPEPGKLFSEEALDNSLDALFSGLESGTLGGEPEAGLGGLSFGEPEPVPAVPSNVVNFPTPAPAAPPAPPVSRPEPIMPKVPSGPLVVETPAATLAPAQPSDFARTGKPVSVPDVLPLSQGVDLRALLATVDRTPGVAGSLLVGHDGLIIMTTLGAEIDRDYLGAQVCNLFTATGVQSHKMQRGELRRMILETASGVMLVTAADMGILVVVSQDGRAMDAAAVMGAIAGALGHA